MNYLYYFRISVYILLLSMIINLIQPMTNISIDPRVKPFYNKFMKVLNQHCNEDQYFNPNFKIEIKELTQPVIGLCISLPNKFIVYLDSKFWEEEGNIDRFTLVAHELTHCMLNQEHVNLPNHYMASTFSYITLEQLYSQMSQLFKEKCNAE